MGSRLVNVRLDEERVKKAQRLRQRGLSLSDLVRDAIDQRFAATARPSAAEAQAIVARIHEQHPDPPDLERRTYDVHDAAASRAAVRRRLRRRSR